mgnify:CR=1 FL=1
MTRRVMIATPLQYGRPEIWYVNAVRHTERLLAQHGIEATPIYRAFDALIQRVRNDLVSDALIGGFDDVVFVDDDIEWSPEWMLRLLQHDADVVGAAYRKKTDDVEMYTVRAPMPIQTDQKTGLWIVDGVGTGFVRLSRRALQALWDSCEEYENEGHKCRWIFDVYPVNGKLVSEDNMMCMKLQALGFPILLDQSFTVVHIGPKKYRGDFKSYVERLQAKAA